MSDQVASDILDGRPYGGVITLISKSLRCSTQTIHCSDCYAFVKIDKNLIINLYAPCAGTADRLLISLYQNLFDEL